MKSSEKTGNISFALVRAQKEFRTIGKDASNPEFRSGYATLDHIVDKIRSTLAENDIAIVQGAREGSADRTMIVETRAVHATGEWIENEVMIPLVGRMLKGGGRADPDPQSGGSAVSYGRRYGLCALLNLQTGEDDDGNAASKPPKRAAKSAPSGAPDEDPYTGVQPVRSGFAGPSYDYPIPFGDDKGKRLGDIPTPGLKRLQKWIRDPEHTDRKAKFAELDKALTDVLAARALGTDVDSEVSRMQAAEDKAADNLPFR